MVISAVLIVLAVVVVAALALAGASVRVLREYERGVVFRLGRVIQQKVEDLLSDKLLSGEFTDGDFIEVTVNDDGEITLEKALDKPEEKLPEPSL